MNQRLQRAKSGVWQHIAHRRDAGLYRALARASQGYLRAYEGTANFRLDQDGELRVLEVIARHGEGTVLDVGANVGEWSLAAAAAFGTSALHAFKPVTSTYERLAANLAPLGERATANHLGMSDAPGTLAMNVPGDGSELSSLLDVGDRSEEVAVSTGDRYAADRGIDRIRFLKVDTEGWDHRVLGGFSGLLGEGRIDCIQFEYGSWALTTRFLLKDFFELLEAHGKVVGKIYPTSVDLGPYRAELEDFRGLNFLAVPADDLALIADLRG